MATKIKLIPNPHYRKSGTKSYVHLMRKYRFTPTKGGRFLFGSHIQQTGRQYTELPVGGKARVQHVLSKKTADTDQPGEVNADDVQNDSMYLAPISIGTPAQTLNLDFDTGSADLWVWSTKLPSATTAQHKSGKIFDPSKSSTFKEQSGSTWKISYGDGSSASGTVGTDTISLGGLKVNNQAIELADTLSAQFQQGTGDGLLGLAFSNINTVQPKAVSTPVENMIAQDDIPKSAELFTANLGSWRDAEEADKGVSFYTFGFIDQDTVAASGEEIYYTPIDKSQGFWLFDSASATVNGKTIARSGNKAIADTGTTLALVDDETCKAIYDAIPGAQYDEDSQGYIYPSNTSEDQLPVVSFAVGDKQFIVQKEDLGFAEAKEGYVYGGIQSRGSMTMDILGDTFLKGIYAIFDVGNLRFGAVQRKELRQNLSVPQSS
ncbi:putative aspartic endopeptidase [Aspergillus similis]